MEKFLQSEDKCLITCNEQLTLITETREWTECRALQKETLEEKVQKTFVQLLSKDRNNADQWFSDCRKNEQVKKTKFELELRKIVDCFLDGYGNFDSNLVSFNMKTL